MSNLKKPKTYMTIESFIYMERQFWQNNGYKYLHDGYRVLINKPNDINQGLFELHYACGWSRKFSQDAPAERSSRGLPFNNCQIAYQPSLRPINGKYPRKECNVEIDSYVKIKFDPIKMLFTYLFVKIDADNKWDYVFKCVKTQQQKKHKFVKFCFIYNQTIGRFKRWKIHY